MKIPAINDYLETVSNPTGRFWALKKFEPVADRDGFPTTVIHTGHVDFLIRMKNRYWLLSCPLRRDPEFFLREREKADRLSDLKDPALAEYHFLPGEMLVYNNAEECGYYDVLLTEQPDGPTLGEYTAKICRSKDIPAINRLASDLFRFASSHLTRAGFVHGNISPKNIRICTNGSLKMTGFGHAVVPSMERWRECRHRDTLPLIYICLFLFCCRSNPSVGFSCEADRIGSVKEWGRWLLSNLRKQEPDNLPEPLRKICGLLLKEEKSAAAFTEILPELVGTAPRKPLKSFDNYPGDHSAPGEHEKYDIISVFSEGTACAGIDGKYGYIDREGHTVIPFLYDWGSAFDEGLAVVKQGDLYGLIDKSGREILPAVYEDLVWHSPNGVAIAGDTHGQWRLFSREGQPVGAHTYDHICDFSAGLACVTKNHKHGYIDREGVLVIPLIFDHAGSFSAGKVATVTRRGRTYAIDTEGNEVC